MLAGTTLFSSGFAVAELGGSSPSSGPSPAEQAAAVVPVDDPADEPVAAVAAALGPAVVQVERGDGLGSGVIYDAEGLVLTNAHVVGGASEVDIVLADGTRLDGEVVGADPTRDLAVVRVRPDAELPVADIGDPSAVLVGQAAIAVGSPFGLQQTVTSGIVSAVERPVESTEVMLGMIQTDAPINPGNSGGALADRAGRVIGINSSIFSESGENNGIGFAIPIDVAIETARRIVEGESLEPARLGVSVGPDPDGRPGAFIEDVVSGSAAAEAGIEDGDRVVAVDGDDVRGADHLVVKVSNHFPGDEVELRLVRDGDTIERTLVLGAG